MSDPLFMEKAITVLPGISDKREKLFQKLGVYTLDDLLWLMPRSYENWHDRVPIASLREGDSAVFEATVDQVPSLSRRGKLCYIRTRLSDDSGQIAAIWFNQPWITEQIRRGERYVFRGKIETKRGRTVLSPEFRKLDDSDLPAFLPVYPLTAGLYQSNIRQAVQRILLHSDLAVEESLPPSIRQQAKLSTADFAIRRIHFPNDAKEIDIARRRLAFEELFLVLAGLRALRAGRKKEKGPEIAIKAETEAKLQLLLSQLPFELTGSQQKTIKAILSDFKRAEPANRLIQGDVGSGKTVVAAAAMAVAAWEGYQSVLMAPTTILAGKHAESLAKILEGTGLEIALLTGAVPAAKRRLLAEQLKKGTIDILIGTHAVLEGDVSFQKLGLCVTDEQHRFGVRQRVSLTGEGEMIPHVLVMSATPIPRTLAMILYGDLDISEMRDNPKGRLPVKTYTATEHERPRVDRAIRREVEKGHKVYVVCPMIEDSDFMDLNSAQTVYERLSKQVFPDLRVALMHGRLKAKEKLSVMEAFGRGEIDILVSTTVIEVGIDQPDATLLVVENAERFGLSQLHQLRGRVGRSSIESFCILMSDSEDPLVKRRLTVLCKNNSGFMIAEEDLLLRGPGDFFGVEQHGLPDFKVANLYEDSELLKEAYRLCDALFKQDPDLSKPENQVIMREFKRRYGERLTRPGL